MLHVDIVLIDELMKVMDYMNPIETVLIHYLIEKNHEYLDQHCISNFELHRNILMLTVPTIDSSMNQLHNIIKNQLSYHGVDGILIYLSVGIELFYYGSCLEV